MHGHGVRMVFGEADIPHSLVLQDFGEIALTPVAYLKVSHGSITNCKAIIPSR
jgi:hypothetical protein